MAETGPTMDFASRRTPALPCISSHGLLSTSAARRPGFRAAHSAAISPPVECPMRMGGSGWSWAMVSNAASRSAS